MCSKSHHFLHYMKKSNIRSKYVKESLNDFDGLTNTLKENTTSAVRDLLNEAVRETYAKILTEDEDEDDEYDVEEVEDTNPETADAEKETDDVTDVEDTEMSDDADDADDDGVDVESSEGFDDDGNLSDVVIPDVFTEGKTVYTRLERHTVIGNDVRITQRAFKSNNRQTIGTEIPLSDVPRWASLEPEATVKNTDGPLFGWYKAATANNVDVDSPLGASVYAKAVEVIEQADRQYSRLLWEFEGSELAIDVDPTVLRPKQTTTADGKKVMETPKLNQRLFRGVDLGEDATYKVFNPTIREVSLLNGLNQLLIRVEDLCGLSRGTLSDANVDARTATELRIVKQRSYATVADNQRALETCLRNVLRAMDKYATMYHLAPEGEYDVSFDWDDSIITDSEQQMNEMLMLYNAGIIGKQEFREWYFKETSAQAKAAIEALQQEKLSDMESLMPAINEGVPAPQ